MIGQSFPPSSPDAQENASSCLNPDVLKQLWLGSYLNRDLTNFILTEEGIAKNIGACLLRLLHDKFTEWKWFRIREFDWKMFDVFFIWRSTVSCHRVIPNNSLHNNT